jgi:uncharacterized protein (TIGR02569 family)
VIPLAAFGLPGEAIRLPGGQGQTWRAGDVVLKPCAMAAEARWVAETLSTMEETEEFRVARPVRALDGTFVADGWQAWHVVAGEPDERRWDDIIRVGAAFHRALEGVPRPDFLDAREDRWTYGERVAWSQEPIAPDGAMADLLQPLAAVRLPVTHPAQPVHGDLLGNVLFAEGLPPAVIDWPVYYRPASWAHAVVIVDALTWRGAPATLAAQADPQMLVRALMYRIATNEGARREGSPVREKAEDYRPVVDLVLALSHGPGGGRV